MALTALDARTALVLIDLQQGLMGATGTPHTLPEVLARSVELADAFRARRAPVIRTPPACPAAASAGA